MSQKTPLAKNPPSVSKAVTGNILMTNSQSGRCAPVLWFDSEKFQAVISKGAKLPFSKSGVVF